MPIVTLVKPTDNNTRKRLESASGGCFGFMASTHFFKGDNEAVTHVAYHVEGETQGQYCKEVFDGKNKLFPFHKFMTVNEFNAFVGEGVRDSRDHNPPTFGYVVVEMRPEEFSEHGIPQDMFISGLFTARNLTAYSGYHRLRKAVKGHPILAYILGEVVATSEQDLPNTIAYVRQRRSSSNVDSTAFGILNLQNIYALLKGKKHVALFGHEGGIFQRGGYKRDHNFSQGVDNFGGIYGTIVKNMNTSIAAIENDLPIINPAYFSPMYFAHVVNAHLGAEVVIGEKFNDRNGIAPQKDNMKFYKDTNPKAKKSYRKGDVVEVRADALGHASWTSRHANALGHAVSYRTTVKDFLARAGFVPVTTRVEKIDTKRGVECVKLTNGTWVAPRYLRLAGTNMKDEAPVSAGEVPVCKLYTQTGRSDRVLASRTYDLFDGTVRCVNVTEDTVNLGNEVAVRRRDLVEVTFE